MRFCLFTRLLTQLMRVLVDHLLRSRAHQTKLELFKKEFNIAKEQFDRNVQIETMQIVFDLCMMLYIPSEIWLTFLKYTAALLKVRGACYES